MKMLKHLTVLVLLITLAAPAVSARTKGEIEQLIKEVEQVMAGLSNSIDTYAPEEKKGLVSQIAKTKEHLKLNQIEDGYIEISLCKHYVNLINARKELLNAQKEYEERERNQR